MTLNQVFAELQETVEKSGRDGALCFALVQGLKDRVEALLRERQNWEGAIEKGEDFEEFMQLVEEAFTTVATLESTSAKDPVFQEATEIAEELRGILQRETGIQLPEVEIVALGQSRLVSGPVEVFVEDPREHRGHA